ncbi:MAG: glycosyltransferase [Candidatus Pacebacteria bacterium]|nr:glycosyltransferase [Candidatus Paceibacterota bacterium]
MKICFFGTYEKNYPSNRIIIKGFKKHGIEIIECHIPLWEKYRNKNGKFLKIFSILKLGIGLLKAYCILFFKFSKKCKKVDVIIIGYIGQLDIIFLKCLLFFKIKKPKIIFIPLVSLYDTAIIDRNLSKENNLFAKLLFYIDKLSFKIADLVIFDTKEHINYISNLFSIDKNKFKRVWVGADEEVFYPLSERNKKTNNVFQVLFFGKYIPLHGIEYIIRAAKLLEKEKSIRIKMIGNGQLYQKIKNLSNKLEIRNIDFIEWIEYDKLLKEINKADVVLGIFGGTNKSLRVIPNKIFQAVACKKAVITGDSSAIKELFTDKKNILLCKNKNPESLKNAILKLKSDNLLKNKISENSYFLFIKKLNTLNIAKKVLKNFKIFNIYEK